MFPDPRTQECEREIERILHLNWLPDRLPVLFNNVAKVTKSHIHAANVHARLESPAIQTTPIKRGSGRDLEPRKRCIQGEVRATCGGVLLSIELDDSEKGAPVDSTKIAINFVKT